MNLKLQLPHKLRIKLNEVDPELFKQREFVKGYIFGFLHCLNDYEEDEKKGFDQRLDKDIFAELWKKINL